MLYTWAGTWRTGGRCWAGGRAFLNISAGQRQWHRHARCFSGVLHFAFCLFAAWHGMSSMLHIPWRRLNRHTDDFDVHFGRTLHTTLPLICYVGIGDVRS